MKLKELQNEMQTQKGTQHITIAVLSNITYEPYFQLMINKAFSNNHISVNVIPVDYSEFLTGSIVEEVTDTDIIAVIPNFENFYQGIYNRVLSSEEAQELINMEMSNMKQICSTIRSKLSDLIIWFSYEDYCFKFGYTLGNLPVQNGLVDKINLQLLSKMENDIIFIDTKQLIAGIGIENAYDNKNKYRWNSLYSQTMIEQICNEIYKQYLIEYGITKKCIVLDCDNVLWGGILSEDGIEDIHLGNSGLGRIYQDFQRFILSLYYHGVNLIICSKNNLSEVLTMFREHSEMILKEEHIACFRVNWEDKPSNIKKIAVKLNIGLNSIVFVDDSPVEIEAVKAMLPEVTTILFKRDMEYEQFSCFNLKSNVSIVDVEKRNETYRTNGFREELKEKYTDYADYIKALEIELDIHEVEPIEYSRISELTQRTNKCTNGKRYMIVEIKERIASDAVKLYSISVSDRFSDLGLVGAIEIEGNTLTLFSLSCRALGREIERKMLNYIGERHQINSIEYHSTGKNDAIETLLAEAFPNATLTNCENH